ncbi:MAG: ABC transporter permease [Candidatus Bathyarchaeia archaeon]
MKAEMQTLWGSFRMSMLNFFSDPQWIIPNIIAPFIFTAVALIFFRNASGSLALYAVLGGGMMGMWGSTLYGAGFALSFDRWNGTLEYVLATPSRLVWIVAGRSASSAILGLVNALAVLVVAVVGFKAQLGIVDPIAFLLALVLTLASLSALGVLFCSSFLLTRAASVLTNGLEMPIYVASGSMFPIALLPFWSHPLSLSLGPTWGIDAMRYAADATYTGMGFGFWSDMLVLFASTIVYLAIGFWLFIVVEKKARRDASLVEY